MSVQIAQREVDERQEVGSKEASLERLPEGKEKLGVGGQLALALEPGENRRW
jgi:hypothetical protein